MTTSLEGKTFSVITYGCQMNKHDSERIVGMLTSLGALEVDTIEDSEIVVFMTCCVREAADVRLRGQGASMKKIPLPEASTLHKRIIAIGVCIGQRDAEKLIDDLPHVDVVFGTFNLASITRLLDETINTHNPCVEVLSAADEFPTNLPSKREHPWSAWLPISIGCNNFCTYCIVPYVRGRERSRSPQAILEEFTGLVQAGYKDITLLGQNVNSYGKDLDEGRDFADLIREINAIPGDFLIRFMTSHPRDATEKLFRTMAECEKCAKHIHLPVQSGSSRVLRAMNRHYDREKYLALVDKARSYMPELVLTTDIIVGFPGETAEDFAETLSLVERVRYDAMFTFIFSPREGTPAAAMPDPVPREEKQRWFDTLVETANRISAEKHAEYAGRRLRVLVDGETGRGEYNLSARTNGGRLVHLKGEPELVGRFIEAEITDWNTWALYGVPAL